MASLVWSDSFDHYSSSQIGSKWDIVTFVNFPVPGRNLNGASLFAGTASGLTKTLTLQSIWMVGFAWSFNGLATGPQTIYDAKQIGTGYVPITLVQFPDSTLAAMSGSNIIAFSNFPLFSNVFYYIEFMFQLSGTVGSPVSVDCLCNVNGQTIFSGSGMGSVNVPVSGVGVTSHNWVAPNNAFGGATIDDVYIGQPVSISASEFFGDVKLQCFFPDSDDPGNQWTGNHTDINNNPANDSVFISDTTVGDESSFGFQAITGSAPYLAGLAIPGVNSFVRANGATITETLSLYLTTGTPVLGAPFHLIPGSFVFFNQPWTINTDLGVAWTVANFNAEHFGVQETST